MDKGGNEPGRWKQTRGLGPGIGIGLVGIFTAVSLMVLMASWAATGFLPFQIFGGVHFTNNYLMFLKYLYRYFFVKLVSGGIRVRLCLIPKIIYININL